MAQATQSVYSDSIPNIAMVNQDVMIASGDLAVGGISSLFQLIPEPVSGYLMANGPDAVTTTMDLVHGVWKNNPFDIQENMIYLGVSLDSNSFGHVYVILDLEDK